MVFKAGHKRNLYNASPFFLSFKKKKEVKWIYICI